MLCNKEKMRQSMTWSKLLADERKQPYFQSIMKVLEEETNAGLVIYPEQDELFSAFESTPYDTVKVVILGQDPYHGPGQAHGLSFSVKPGIKTPPSLKNIFKALHYDLALPIPNHGCLSAWANQGVLLLNTSLSVIKGKAQSHAHIGWSVFTDKVLTALNNHPQPLVFLLWGAHAIKKNRLISDKKHLILTAPHPSPLSAHKGFLHCAHFSKANEFLKTQARGPIEWRL